MINRIFTLFSTVAEILPFKRVWDLQLEELLSKSSLSQTAKAFIRLENNSSGSGRKGYIGKAAYLMGRGDPRNPVAELIWLDSSLQVFGLRVVDDFFDNSETDISFDEKKKRLNWESIVLGNRGSAHDSPQEEASVFFLNQMVEKFGNIPGYLSLMNRLYDAVSDVEDASLTNEERKKRSLEGTCMTVESAIYSVKPYGVELSDNVNSAIRHLSKATGIWDNLSDVIRDSETGAFNFIIEDAKLVVKEGESLLKYIRNLSGHKFMSEASQELDAGEKLLTGKPKEVYRALRTLMTLKCHASYVFNTHFNRRHSVYSSLKFQEAI